MPSREKTICARCQCVLWLPAESLGQIGVCPRCGARIAIGATNSPNVTSDPDLGGAPISPATPTIIPMAELEKKTILNAISELNGDKLRAARLLGIGKTTLYRKLKDYAAQGYQL